ncbi:hypothetical protein PHACT_06830 [Pseudohongiella acticola]|uniref:Big-1 domain-containing protein n=1 Tax=Pseudohongiella acticola TaxID=1524254 RepID=A0A1E8CKD2_9GAMM|nr:hypothetical protein PHACT_06830 [Pseudohongiella acticola]
MRQERRKATRVQKTTADHEASLWRWCVRGVWALAGVLVAAGLVIAQVPGPVNVRGTGGTIGQVSTPLIGTGGTISTQGAYTVHVFNSNGTFTPPSGLSSLDVLIVGGGGGGGSTYGGGGGGGGVRALTNVTVNQPSYAVVVGAGGAGGAAISTTNDTSGNGQNGGNSSFGAEVSLGGGYGQGGAQSTAGGGNGGSGGGGGGTTANAPRPAGNGTAGQGSNGGAGSSSTTAANRAGGGGGGAGAAGSAGTDNAGGNGGAGLDFSAVVGTGVGQAGWFGGGGGGGKRNGGGTAGTGGQGGGGAGGPPSSPGTATAGQANTGGGGGGSGNNGGTPGANGGSGIVIVRYIAPTQTFITHTFTSSGTFNRPPGVSQVDVLVVAGGGGGGTSRAFSTAGAGGGGAGGLVYRTGFAVGSSVAVTVGAGGAGGPGTGHANGINGGNSVFGSLTALGGGGGAGGNAQGSSGGSGGGSRGNNGGVATQPGAATTGFGFRGGNMPGSPGGAPATGGGGAGGAGQDIPGNANENGGQGGVGLQYSISGTPTFYAGGGGGGASQNSSNPGAGGQGGGGAGGRNDTPATAGTANRGGGGGGGNNSINGAAGGSGIVIVRYAPPRLTMDVQPSTTAQSGEAFATAPRVVLRDASNNPVQNATVNVAIASGGGTLGGTTAVQTNASGQAIFNGLSITGTTGNRTLSFTVNGTTGSVVSNNIEIIAGPHFEIEHAALSSTCSPFTVITINVVDSSGDPVTDFEGTVTITNDANNGDYDVVSGFPGNFTNLGNGSATYEFISTDTGTVDLEFYTTTANASLSFDANSGSIETENYGPPLEIGQCSFTVSHNIQGGVCAASPITFAVLGADDQPLLDYVGEVTISSSPGTGNWSNTFGAQGQFSNGAVGDGIATYTFDEDDDGEVTLGYTNVAGNYTFNITSEDGDVATISDDDGQLTVSACSFRIFLPGDVTALDSSVCRVEEVRIRVVNASATVIPYTGTINLSTVGITTGDWSKTGVAADAFGALTSGPGDGSASYSFQLTDEGEITLDFAVETDATINFNIVAANVAQPSGNFDPTIDYENCVFRIEFPDGNDSDVCSIAQVDITIVDRDGDAVDDYEGQVELSTSTGFGSWEDISLSDGTLSDAFAEDGFATYEFEDTDDGTISLGFRHRRGSGPVNINITDDVNQDAGNSANMYDQNLEIELCTFEIILPEAESNACSITQVQFTVRDRDAQIASDFEGVMRITNNVGRGDWYENGGSYDALPAPSGADAGVADYTFSGSGQVTLVFSSASPAQYNFDVVDDEGLIVEATSADPTLFYTGCFPEIFAGPVCTDQGGQGNSGLPTNEASIAIPAASPIAGTDSRMVLMTTHQIENRASVNTGTSATFDGDAMAVIKRQFNNEGPYSLDVAVEMWAIFGDDLPTGAGTFDGVFNGGAAGTSTTICLTSVIGVAQEIPVEAANPATGPLNGTNYSEAVNGTTFRHDATTTITTQANNSFIFSATANDTYGNPANSLYHYLAAQPSPLVGVWGGYDTGQTNPPPRVAELQSRPANGYSGGSAGVLSSLGVITVVEPFNAGGNIDTNVDPTINAHIVAAFKPRVEGVPLAEDFEPVILYKTYSGAISYRAIGASLRNQASNPAVNGAVDCSFVDFSVGTEAELDMPPSSSVRAAYLYWAGQGSPAQVDDTVTFGRDGDPEFQIVADEIFNIIGTSTAEVDFFAGYADVTELVTQNGDYRVSDFAVSNTGDWDNNATCAAGWSLVVVYDNDDEQLRVVNLFHGFQPFQWASFTLVPRNFRMATYDEDRYLPNGQVTHFTLEGDETLNNGDESLGIQDAPDSVVFNNMSQEHTNSYNPINNEFNGTITRPIFELYDNGVDPPFYSWIGKNEPPGIITNSQNDDGYEIDFPGPDAQLSGRSGDRIGSSYGVDIDTHYLGNETLFDFSQPNNEAERITTRYSSGQDLVMLVSEIISVTNFPIADIEVFLSQSGDFKVNGDGSYQITVTNNGNGTSTGGDATGVVTVAMQLPAGMTFANAGQVVGTGWSCNVTLAPSDGAFTCTYDIGNVTPLASGADLPVIDIDVDLSGPDVFTLNQNNRTVTARGVHTGGNCTPTTTGLVPLESTCDRSPQFDNKYDLQGGAINPNTVTAKTDSNNNVASVISTVQGIRTDLRIVKTLVDSLEVDQPGQYQLVVTNLGPDDTTVPFTLSDVQPSGVTFTGFSSTDTEWSCSTLTPTLNCEFDGELALNESTTLLLDVLVTGSARTNVVNTAQVVAGDGNFDNFQSNNTSTNSSTIVGPPVAGQERFLLSVSTPGNDTSIGGLNNFENHDLIIYDPQTDEAVMFFDDSVSNGSRIDDINAVHLLKNGHIILSANGSSVIGTNNLAFEPWDLVRYDPITGEAFMFLQGSTVFDNFASVNINGVYINDDCPASANHSECTVLLSTTGGATTSFDSLSFTSSDIIALDRSGANVTASVYLEGSDDDVFGATEGNGNVDLDAFYVRVDPNDPTATIDTLALSVDNETAIIGDDPAMDPVDGTVVTRDDVTQLNRTDNTTENLFLGDQELGVFTPDVLAQPTAAERRLDALHLVEDGYHGHFSVRVVQAGSVCAFALVRISKHDGLTHDRDTDYYGSVRLATSTGVGNWSEHTGVMGSLNNGTLDDGAAVYRFDPDDNGTVVLRLSYDETATIKITATNGIASVLASESPNFVFNDELTEITWEDLFNTVSYSRNDGTRNWTGDWTEVDGESAAIVASPATGNVRVINDVNNIPGHQKLRLRSNNYAINNSIEPSLMRTFNLASVPATEAVVLSFNYNFTGVAPTDQVVVEARGTSTGNPAWTQLASYTSASASGSGMASLNLTTALGGNPNLSTTSQIRFRIANGYAVTGRFFIDNVKIATATDECGYTGSGSLNHYAISHSGFGISCVGTPITITAHDAADGDISANGETINISVSPAKGVWARVLNGGGTLTPIASQTDNGVATYAFPQGEESVSLLLNYTVPAGAMTPVNISVQGQTSTATEDSSEDPTLQIAEAGLVFYNETQDNYTIGTQIAGKPSNVAPLGHLLTVQGVRSSDQDPMQCVPLFDAGQTLPIEIAAECNDNDSCVSGESFTVNGEAVALVDDNGGAGASAYTEVELDFITQPSGDIGATIELNYSDVGRMQLHSRYNIPFGFFGDTLPDDPLNPPGVSNDYMTGISNLFVVRPFGFAIDFPGDEGLDRADSQPADNFPDRAGNTADSLATDSDGNVFVYAGEGFDTLVTAMAWQAVDDDADQDGQPDVGANLYDNRPTPNFYYDSDGQADDYRVRLTVLENQAEALGGVRGSLTSDTLTFNNFDNYSAIEGTGSASISYNEVGIIDMQAELVDSGNNALAYLGTDVIRGVVNDVGRFYPRRFDVVTTALLPRVAASCVPPSLFTYMDEPFGIELDLVARNIQGATTVNYRGGFAKLATYAQLNFRAIEEVASADNNDLSARLDNISIPANYQATWSSVQGGELALEGNLAFSRADPAVPDGPFEDTLIAFVPIDSDGVTLDPGDLDTEITEATPEYNLIAEHDFRYGRLLINNAFGPETEDLAITFRVEYFDGERFVVNTDDSCTIIDADELTLVPGTYTGNLDDGETEIVTPQTTEFHNGQVQGVESGTNPSDETFTATAAGEGNSGTVDVELDLDELGLPFLQFRWPEIDADYDENPRAQLEFGQFRSHDRVIHWQEIYNGPTPP